MAVSMWRELLGLHYWSCMCLDQCLTVPLCTPTPHLLLAPPPPGECQLVNDTCKFTHSSLKCKIWVDLNSGNMCSSVTDPEYMAFVKNKVLSAPKGFGQYLPPKTSSVCQSTTAVSGTILASLERDCLLMAMSVALLTNTMHFSTDHHLFSRHYLGRLYETSIHLASVPLGKTSYCDWYGKCNKNFWMVCQSCNKISTELGAAWAKKFLYQFI